MTQMPKLAELTAKPRLERLEQSAVIGLFRSFGCVVHSTSQYRASRIDGGLPDLLVHHPTSRQFWWFETKKYRRVNSAGVTFKPFHPETWEPEPLRPDQQTFADLAYACQQRYAFGGIRQAMAVLVDAGLAKWYGPTIERIRAA